MQEAATTDIGEISIQNQERPAEHSVRLDAQRNQTWREDVCFRCGKNGHLARDCTTDDERRCFRCNKPGHLARNCHLKTLQASGRKDTRMNDNRCNRCGNTGHIAKYCRTDVNLECRKCGKKGHTEEQCRQRQTGARTKYNSFNMVDEHTGQCAGCGHSPAYITCGCCLGIYI